MDVWICTSTVVGPPTATSSYSLKREVVIMSMILMMMMMMMAAVIIIIIIILADYCSRWLGEGMGKQEIVIRFPTGQETSLQCVQSYSGAHQASNLMGIAVTLPSMHEASFQCRRTPHMPSWRTRRLLLLRLVCLYRKECRGTAILLQHVLCHFLHIFGLFVQLVSIIVSLYSLYDTAHSNVLLKN